MIPADSWDSVDLRFDLVLTQLILLFIAMFLVSAVNLSTIIALRAQKSKPCSVFFNKWCFKCSKPPGRKRNNNKKISCRRESSISIREKDTCIHCRKINDILSIPYDFDKHEKDTCVKSSGMITIFDKPYNFRLTVKFSTHTMDSARAKRRFSSANYFRLTVLHVFALSILH